MDRNLLQRTLFNYFSSAKRNAADASGKRLSARKLRMETLEDRQMLCAAPYGTDEVCACACASQLSPIVSNCSALVVQEGAVVEEASSLANIMDELLIADGQNPDNLSEDYIFNLSSNPSSSFTIYLDLNGNVAKGTYWNDGKDVVTPAYDTDGNLNSFSNSELRDIYEIWLRVSEDYMPFNVNVTTKEPTVAQLSKTSDGDMAYGVRVAIGGSCYDWYNNSCGGVAYVGSFDWNSDTPAFVFPKQLYTAKNVAEAASHETGHTLGLGHDGNSTQGYYGGADGWAPIMGTGYSQPLTQWSKGEYYDANNHEDDLEIITSKGFDYRNDDHGGTIEKATPLTFAATGFLGSGIIERNTDVDFFSFELNGQQSVITVGGYAEVTNLDAVVSIYDANKNLVATYDPSNTTNVSIDVSDFPAGKYYMSVAGTGLIVDGSTIYSDYASLGAYTIETALSTEVADPYEPNETQVGSFRLGVISEPTTIAATIDPRSDQDYFNFSLGEGYSGVKITIDYEASSKLALNFCKDGEWEFVSNNGSKTYYALTSDDSLYFNVNASSFKAATQYRVTITPLENPELTSVSLSTAKAKVGKPISAVLPYEGLTAAYQWYRGTSENDMVAISGATGATYVPTEADLGYQLKVVANGYGNCYGSASATSEKVAAQTVWTVGSLSDEASSSPLTLRQALASADDGDRIVFAASLNGQTISVGSTLAIDKSLTIDASMLSDGITLNGNNNVKLVKAGENTQYLEVKGVTFAKGSANGTGGAAIDFTGAILKVDGCSFIENAAAASGSATIYGGAVSVGTGDASFADSTFVGNTLQAELSANSGGAAIGGAAGSLITITGSTFQGNNTNKSGGAVRSYGNMVVSNSTFSGNAASGPAGGAIWADGSLQLIGDLIVNNTADSYGGGVYACNGFDAYNCTVVGNSVTYFGGGLYVAGGKGRVFNSIVVSNSSQRASGADLEKDSSAWLYGYSNITSYTKWTAGENNKAASATKPLFTDAENGDYSIPANSQAVDAGDNNFVASTRDITGNTRVYNSVVDIGAYEYMLAPKPNLLFAAPAGWESAAMLTDAQDSVVGASTFKIGETYYLRFGVANDSNVAIANSFVIRVFIDDAVAATYSLNSFGADSSTDYTLKLGSFDAGTHQVFISIDAGAAIEESNENDNEFTLTFKAVDDDDYEPNDAIENATDLGTLLQQSVVGAKAGAEQNQDWFRFTTTTIGTADSFVHLSYAAAADAKLALEIYNASGVLIVDSTLGAGEEEISLNALEAGNYFVCVKNLVDTASSIPYELTLQPPAPPKADVTQATPEGWSSPIVVNTTSDATTSAESFYENQSYFANFCISNASPTPILDAFYVEAYLDGVLVETFTVNRLGAYGVKQYSVDLGFMTVGSHMVKIVVDSTNAIEEESETNNTFTQTFNVSGVDDEYEPNDTIVASYNLGSLIETQTLSLWAGSDMNEDWFRFSMPEPGTSAGRIVVNYEHVSEAADVDLYLYDESGEQVAYSNRATGTELISLNGLPAGVYYARAFNCCNVQQSVPYEITFYPSTVAKPNLKPVALATWSDSILVAPSSSSSADAETWFDGTNYYVRFAFTNDASVAIENSFTVKCYLDDVLVKTYEVEPMAIGANKSFSFSSGTLDLGTHSIRVELDTENVVDESNKFDNVYAKTIFVQSGDDEYEPNDTMEEASDLGVLVKTSSYSLNAQGGQNEDWFKFTTVSEGVEGDCVVLTYEHTPSVADVDLYLYDSEGTFLRSSKLVTGTETVSLEGLPAGDYYVCAYNYFDKTLTVPYVLAFNAPQYRTGVPTIAVEAVSPIDAVVTLGPVDDATLYTVQYSIDETFEDAAAVTTVHAGALTISDLAENTQYFFRAKASSNELPDSPWSEVVSVTTPEKTQLAAPAVSVAANGPNGLIVTIEAVDGADGYALEYADNAAFENAISVDAQVGNVAIDGLTHDTNYFVRVKAQSARDLDSEWTIAQGVTGALKKLAIPQVKVETAPDSINLTWNPVFKAAGYFVEYKLSTASSYKTKTVSATEFTLDGVPSGTGYTIRVRAVGDGVEYTNSDRYVLNVATEQQCKLTIPQVEAESSADSIALSWAQIAHAESYLVEYKPEDSESYYKTLVVDSNSCVLNGLESETNYSIRVRANGNGRNYLNSDRCVLTVATDAVPTVAVELFETELQPSVKDAQTIGSVAVKGLGSDYAISVSVDGEATDAITVAGDALVYNGGLEVGEHTITVSASNGGDAASDTVAIIVSPKTLSVPTDLAVDVNAISVSVSWSEVFGADSYKVSLFSMNGLLIGSTVSTETTASFNGLSEKTSYTVAVRAAAFDAADSEDASVSFTTPAKKKLAIPRVDVKVESNAISLSWNANANATKYLIEYKLASAKSYKTVYVETPEYRIEGLKASSTYDVRVKAYSGAELLANSDRRVLSVTTDAAAVEAQLDAEDDMFEILAASLLN